MSEKLREIEEMTLEEVIKHYDKSAEYTCVGLSFWQEIYNNKKQEQLNQELKRINRQMLLYTKIMTLLTIVVVIATIMSLIITVLN